MKKYLASLLLLFAVSAHAAISWAGWCVTTTAATGTGTNFSQWITTTANANPCLVFSCTSSQNGHSNSGFISSITFGGSSFNYLTVTIASPGGSSNAQSEVWYLANPPASTAGQLAITMNNTANSPAHLFRTTEYDGINQTTPLGNNVILSNGTASSGASTISPAYSGGWFFQMVGARSAGSIVTPDIKTTPISNANYSNAAISGSFSHTTWTAASTAFTYTWGGGYANGQIVAELVPWVASPTSTFTPTWTPTYTQTGTPTCTSTATPTYTSTATPSPTSTATPSPSITPTFTNTPQVSIQGIRTPIGYSSAGLGFILFKKISIPFNIYKLGSINAYVSSGYGQIKAALYSDYNGAPFNLIEFSQTPTYASSGWTSVAFSAGYIIPANSAVWLAVEVQNSAMVKYSEIGTDLYGYAPFGTWPSPVTIQTFLGTANINGVIFGY